jgi:hypothetical protein
MVKKRKSADKQNKKKQAGEKKEVGNIIESKTPPLKKRGIPVEKVYVDSKTYSPHIRNRRGSVNPCGVNAAFQKSSEHLKIANEAARILKQSVDKYRDGFTGGQLWQNLVSVLKNQIRDGSGFDLGGFRNMEVNEQFSLRKRFHFFLKCDVEQKDNILCITISSGGHPKFGHVGTDGYQMSLIVIWSDFKDDRAWDTLIKLPIIKYNDAHDVYEFKADVGDKKGPFFLCLKIIGCDGDTLLKKNEYGGMRVVNDWRLDRVEPGTGRKG